MWTGTIRFLATVVLAVCTLSSALAAEITLVGIILPGSIKYPEWTKEESQDNLVATISKVLGFHIDKESHAFYGLPDGATHVKSAGVDLSKSKERTLDAFSKMAASAKTRFVVFIQVVKIGQKNQKEGAILNNLGKPESDTDVEVIAELFDAEQKFLLRIPSDGSLKATFKGPYFGTTKKDEISGDPQTKAIVIRNENRKRMEAVGQAVWLAIRDRLLIQLKSS